MAHFPAKVSACVSAIQAALHIIAPRHVLQLAAANSRRASARRLDWNLLRQLPHHVTSCLLEIPSSLHLALLRWTAFLQEMTSAILGGTSEPAEGVSIPIQMRDLSWVQEIWFAILDVPEASPQTFLASGETLKSYQDLWAGCCMLPQGSRQADTSPDVVHAMMQSFALAGQLLIMICALALSCTL